MFNFKNLPQHIHENDVIYQILRDVSSPGITTLKKSRSLGRTADCHTSATLNILKGMSFHFKLEILQLYCIQV